MKKSYSRLVLLTTMTLSLSLGSVASLDVSAEKISVKLEVGQTIRYKTVAESTSDMIGQSSESTVTTVSKAEVLSSSKGWSKLRVTNESFDMSGDAPPGSEDALDAMKDLVVTFDVNSRGLTRNTKIENIDDLDPMMQQTLRGSARALSLVGFMGVHFPEKAIDTGSTWSVKIKGTDMFGEEGMFTSVDGDLPFEFKVLGFEDYKGKRHIKIEAIMDGDLEMVIESPAGDLDVSMTLETKSIYWVDVATGLVSKSTSEGETNMDFGFGSMEQTSSSVIEILK